MKETIELMRVNKLTISLTNRHLATLVGLRNLRVRIGRLLCVDGINNENKMQFKALEKWLDKNNFPPIEFVDSVCSCEEEQTLSDYLLKIWRWSDKDCESVLRLEGLPLI